MKKIILIFSLFFSNFVMANWTELARTETPNNTFYVDYSSVKRIGSYLRAWVMTDRSQPNKFGNLSSKDLFEIDCSQGRLRSITWISYAGNMGSGAVKNSINTTSEWEYASPGDINDAIVKKICSR